MFSIDTYHALDIMVFLALNYEKRTACFPDISRYCSVHEQKSKDILDRLEDEGLVRHCGNGEGYSLSKAPYNISLSDIILPLEPSVFADYTGKSGNRLPSDKAGMLYRKFRPFQQTMERKLKRCRLSEWALMDNSTLFRL